MRHGGQPQAALLGARLSDGAPAKVDLSELDKLGIEIRDTRLVIPPDLPSAAVARVAMGLLFFEKRWQWWFLDCYLDIQEKEGKEAASQLLDGLSYSNRYLHNIITYGRKVAYEARSLEIDFTKYESIALLPQAEQADMVEQVKGDRDSGDKEMVREEVRGKVSDRLNEIHAGEAGKEIPGKEAKGEEPPHPIYDECKRCKTCPECHGTQSVRVG